MTGFGEATQVRDGWELRVEIRSVNNRHLKVNFRADESLLCFENEVEKLVRNRLHRGTVLVVLDSIRPSRADSFKVNRVALDSYLSQVVEAMGGRIPEQSVGALVGGILQIEGVVADRSKRTAPAEGDWGAIAKVIESALDQVALMRQREGGHMALELLAMSKQVREMVAKVRARVPASLTHQQERLQERVRQLLAHFEPRVELEQAHLAREIALLADRVDISEEMIRLESHLDQFESMIQEPATDEGTGRKLEFLIQEMGREVNTMGSKSPDVDISRTVVEIKAMMERIRELVLNVE